MPVVGDDDWSSHEYLTESQVGEHWDCIECLSSSLQRVRILSALDTVPADLRDLKDTSGIPRTTLQRNLTTLEQRGWIEKTSSRYTTTVTGSLLVQEFVTMIETVATIDTLSPFLDALDTPTNIDLDQLREPRVTVPEPHQPHRPTIQLLETLDTAARIRGFLPAVSLLLVQHACRMDDGTATEREYVLSKDALPTLHEQYADEWTNATQMSHIDVLVYEGDLPHGLFVFEDGLALTAYDDFGRIQALVESDGEEAIDWGERMYKKYRQQSRQLSESEQAPESMNESEVVDRYVN